MTQTLLLIEDDARLQALLGQYLEPFGFRIEARGDGLSGLAALDECAPDLVILDVMLPGMNGFEVCRAMRQRSQVPIIMLTARGEVLDRVAGLEMGADDYLPKPFNPRELVARINAVLRRRVVAVPGAPAEIPEIVSFGECALDLGRRILTRNGEEQPLTTGEFGLLKVLATHPRQPLSRDRLSELARGKEYGAFDRAIDVQISRLRKLVEPDAASPRHIQTVRGFGYVFVPE